MDVGRRLIVACQDLDASRYGILAGELGFLSPREIQYTSPTRYSVVHCSILDGCFKAFGTLFYVIHKGAVSEWFVCSRATLPSCC